LQARLLLLQVVNLVCEGLGRRHEVVFFANLEKQATTLSVRNLDAPSLDGAPTVTLTFRAVACSQDSAFSNIQRCCLFLELRYCAATGCAHSLNTDVRSRADRACVRVRERNGSAAASVSAYACARDLHRARAKERESFLYWEFSITGVRSEERWRVNPPVRIFSTLVNAHFGV
jgi:hypothetical protein